LETPLRVLWREFGDRRLFSDDKVRTSPPHARAAGV